MRILVLGVSGMLGNTVFRYFSESTEHRTLGYARNGRVLKFFSPALAQNILVGADVDNQDALSLLFAKAKPDVVINCIGLIKQVAGSSDPLQALPINALLPHRLARFCQIEGARLVHISTDCIFSGKKGNYTESDVSDVNDLYGLSKFLGEVDYPQTVTLRTSIIGHELASNHGLVEWCLSQDQAIRGFTNAIFSGLPAIELAYIIRDIVVPPNELSGIYHIASDPISKFDLLKLVVDRYGKKIEIVPDGQFMIDRSLNAEKFRLATGYRAPAWPELVNKMANFK